MVQHTQDYLYECGPDHDAGEQAHWCVVGSRLQKVWSVRMCITWCSSALRRPPFQAAAAHYILDKFPQPWNETAQKLVVFMLGVVSHYIAGKLCGP